MTGGAAALVEGAGTTYIVYVTKRNLMTMRWYSVTDRKTVTAGNGTIPLVS
jgi:hypothetical protein